MNWEGRGQSQHLRYYSCVLCRVCVDQEFVTSACLYRLRLSQLRAETTKVWITFYRPANLVNNSNLQVKQARRHKFKILQRANGGREKQTQVWINPHWPSNLRPWAPPRPQASWCRQRTTRTARSLHFTKHAWTHWVSTPVVLFLLLFPNPSTSTEYLVNRSFPC